MTEPVQDLGPGGDEFLVCACGRLEVDGSGGWSFQPDANAWWIYFDPKGDVFMVAEGQERESTITLDGEARAEMVRIAIHEAICSNVMSS